MTETISAATHDGGVTLHLHEADMLRFHGLPPLPVPEPEDFEPPSIIVQDVVTGRIWDLCRFIQAPASMGPGGQWTCMAYATDITDAWRRFAAGEDDDAQP